MQKTNMTKTNMDLNNGIDAEMLMEWGMSLIEILGDFVDVLKASVPVEEKDEDDSPACDPCPGCNESARIARLLGYLEGVLTAEGAYDDCEEADDDPDDDNRDNDNTDGNAECNKECNACSQVKGEACETEVGIYGSINCVYHRLSDADMLAPALVIEPGEGYDFVILEDLLDIYSGLIPDPMDLFQINKEAGLCVVLTGNEFFPEDGKKVCLRGPVIMVKRSGDSLIWPDYRDIVLITDFLEKHADRVDIPGQCRARVFSLQKGEIDGSEGI